MQADGKAVFCSQAQRQYLLDKMYYNAGKQPVGLLPVKTKDDKCGSSAGEMIKIICLLL